MVVRATFPEYFRFSFKLSPIPFLPLFFQWDFGSAEDWTILGCISRLSCALYFWAWAIALLDLGLWTPYEQVGLAHKLLGPTEIIFFFFWETYSNRTWSIKTFEISFFKDNVGCISLNLCLFLWKFWSTDLFAQWLHLLLMIVIFLHYVWRCVVWFLLYSSTFI